MIILLDTDFNEIGWWGPRPGTLQAWVTESGLALPKDERYRQVRTWYARDHGKTAVNELLELMEKAEARAEGANPRQRIVQKRLAEIVGLYRSSPANDSWGVEGVNPSFAEIRSRRGSWCVAEILMHLAMTEELVAKIISRSVSLGGSRAWGRRRPTNHCFQVSTHSGLATL